MRTLLALALLTPILVAAPVPEDKEKPKPRAKLLGTLTTDAAVTSAFWLSDGKHFALVTRDKLTVYPRDSFASNPPKPLATLDRPDSARWEAGPTSDGGLFVLSPAGDRLNAENTLYVWSARTLQGGGEPKPDRTVTLEVDNPQGLTFSSDGGSLFAMVIARGPKVKGSPMRFVRLSAKTGDVRKVVPFDDLSEDRYLTHAFDPRTGRLYLATTTAANELAAVQCREADGGKQLWSATLPGQPNPQGVSNTATLLVSANGQRLVVHHPTRLVRPNARPQPGARPEFDYGRAITVLNTEKGEVIPDAGHEPVLENQRAAAPAVSSDGRLLFTAINSRVAVTDLKTGTEVKAWERPGANAVAAFQPGGYELLLVERETPAPSPVSPSPTTGEGGRRETREAKSIVGVWDFDPVVK